MRRLVRAVVTVLALGGPAAASAQGPSRVSGQVLDRVSRAPVSGAEILAGELRAVTGTDGGFVLGNVPPGRIEMRVRRIGYAPLKETMDVVPALERTITITLEPLPVQLDSLTVAAAISGVAIDLHHDQADPDGRRDADPAEEDVDVDMPYQSAYPWAPSMAQRARALELVDVRYNYGDWQSAFLIYYRNAVREQDHPQMAWALAEFCSQTLQSHGREEGAAMLRYELAVTHQGALEEEQNRDDT